MSKKRTLNDKARAEIVEQLGYFLADTFILYVKTLNYHWNMEGSEFFMFHKLLEEQYKEMSGAADDLAEQIRILGHRAPATLSEFLQLSSIDEPKGAKSMEQMVTELAHDHDEMCEQCHGLIALCDELNDQGTSDLLVERIRFHSKQHWLLRSHLKN